MYEYYLALSFFASALCVDIEITGDLAFDVKIRNYSGAGERPRGVDVDIPLRFSIGNNDDDKPKIVPPREHDVSGLPRVIDDDGGNATSSQRLHSDVAESSLEASNKLREDQVVSDVSGDEGSAAVPQTTKSKHKHQKKKKEKSTQATTSPAECPYRYPEPWEANAVLSNMMNKLTKLFVMMSRSLYSSRPRSRAEAAKLRRFEVISARNHDAFDRIFHNMSAQYKLDYNASRERSLRSHGAGAGAGAECASQAAVGRAWRRLLEQAQNTYRAAALRCMDLQLGPWLAGSEGSMQGHLNSALSSANKQMLKDVERIRSEQLRVLCRIYKLC